ncbi:hypothetical protein LAL4801_03228 [Roseibium aggregatum]|uniref:Uncharacterized protein n=2 Tax=Roseibium aggregatum TaxID=187304 RepID=A0A0M6Y6Z3_9HYPH|nr:hypothetical protein LAL4801_03228 [Roseibium aggregatum]
MLFVLKTSCFIAEPNTLRLIQLSDFVLKGRHRLYVSDDAQEDYVTWVRKLPRDLSEIWRRSLELSMELEALEPARYTVTVCETAEPILSLSAPVVNVNQAYRLAREPYKIFVENDDADRDFLLTFSDAQQKAKIEELERENLISFEHCGGITEIPKKVENFIKNDPLFIALCTSVFDSDAPQPHEPSRQADNLKLILDTNGVKAFMLERRAIENYLMRSWLNTWANTRPNRASKRQYVTLFNNFCKLSAMQRKYFHMKRGLSADNKGISDGSIDLYNDVEKSLLEDLEDGFGSNVGSDIFSESWVQNSQPSEDPEAWEEVNGVVREIMVQCR